MVSITAYILDYVNSVGLVNMLELYKHSISCMQSVNEQSYSKRTLAINN